MDRLNILDGAAGYNCTDMLLHRNPLISIMHVYTYLFCKTMSLILHLACIDTVIWAYYVCIIYIGPKENITVMYIE